MTVTKDRDAQIVWGHNTINTSMSKKNVSTLIDMMGNTFHIWKYMTVTRSNGQRVRV